jgi:ABC-type sugar transport system permease subunit
VLARLQTIRSIYEAARVDGASAGAVPLHHAAPAPGRDVRRHPAARDLDVHEVRHGVAVGRGRGRGAEIRTLPIYTFMRTFTYYQAGFGAALSVIMFLMLMAATAVYFRLFWRDEEKA